MQNSNTIPQLLETIQSFKVVQCNMHHERVAHDLNKHPIYRIEDDTIIFDRVNLCDINSRNIRLGCAHSGVNLNFERVLERLVKALPHRTDQILNFKTEFGEVIAQIYALDHEVGHLEGDLATCQLNADDIKKATTNKSLSILKAEHRKLMIRLSIIKSDIEQLIKQQLKYKN